MAASLKDVSKALHGTFGKKPTTASELPPELREILESFVGKHPILDEEDAEQLQKDLVDIYKKHVSRGNKQKKEEHDEPSNLERFIHVLKILRPLVAVGKMLQECYKLVIAPVLNAAGHTRMEINLATELTLDILVYNAEGDGSGERAKSSKYLTNKLLDAYIERTRPNDKDGETNSAEDDFVASQLENMLVAFGQKRPKDLMLALDRLVVDKDTRLQALGLLNAFARDQPPHLYQVTETPIIQHLLRCLFIDTSMVALSLALNTLIMFLPHIPSSVRAHLPRLFLIYSRILVWERFSPDKQELAEGERDPGHSDEDDADYDDNDDDDDLELKETKEDPEDAEEWEQLEPSPEDAASAVPELTYYFTFLYGLYPLNFMSYCRNPRKYLRRIGFPNAEDFDLDKKLIKQRTQRYSRLHVLNPAFFTTTVEDELEENKWLKSDPADVVAECISLYLAVPVQVKDDPMLDITKDVKNITVEDAGNGAVPVVPTERDANGESPTLGPSLIPQPSGNSIQPNQDQSKSMGGSYEKSTQTASQTFLQREVILLRNDLNFERYLKQQHLAHIGQLQRRNVREATVEAETQNLINNNRVLKEKLKRANDQLAFLKKETKTARDQSKKFEGDLSTRLKTLKEAERKWLADEEELRTELQRTQSDCNHLRALVVASESKELLAKQEASNANVKLEVVDELKEKIDSLEQRIRTFEARELDFEAAKDTKDDMQSQLTVLQRQLQARQTDQLHTIQTYETRITDLEAQVVALRDPTKSRDAVPGQLAPAAQFMIDQATATMKTKYSKLKRSHAELQQRYGDLENRVREFEASSPYNEFPNSPFSPSSYNTITATGMPIPQGLRPQRPSRPDSPSSSSPRTQGMSSGTIFAGSPSSFSNRMARNKVGSPNKGTGMQPGLYEEPKSAFSADTIAGAGSGKGRAARSDSGRSYARAVPLNVEKYDGRNLPDVKSPPKDKEGGDGGKKKDKDKDKAGRSAGGLFGIRGIM